MSKKIPRKRADVSKHAKALHQKDRITFSNHANDRMKEREILQNEVFEVIEKGKRESDKDEYKGESFGYSYAFKGYVHSTQRTIRICIGFSGEEWGTVVTVVEVIPPKAK